MYAYAVKLASLLTTLIQPESELYKHGNLVLIVFQGKAIWHTFING